LPPDGVAGDDIELFSWPLSDTYDPSFGACRRPGRSRFAPIGPTAMPRRRPLGRGAFTAIPLGLRATGSGREQDDLAPGLLLLARAAITNDINWLVTVLGQKIDQVRGRGSLAEEHASCGASGRCFSPIINAVTDPIMLTDTEGRLIVANARAEKLFAASERK
jgi:PAS domain-containing protein